MNFLIKHVLGAYIVKLWYNNSYASRIFDQNESTLEAKLKFDNKNRLVTIYSAKPDSDE